MQNRTVEASERTASPNADRGPALWQCNCNKKCDLHLMVSKSRIPVVPVFDLSFKSSARILFIMDEIMVGAIFCGSLGAALALQKALLKLLLHAIVPSTPATPMFKHGGVTCL